MMIKQRNKVKNRIDINDELTNIKEVEKEKKEERGIENRKNMKSYGVKVIIEYKIRKDRNGGCIDIRQ